METPVLVVLVVPRGLRTVHLIQLVLLLLAFPMSALLMFSIQSSEYFIVVFTFFLMMGVFTTAVLLLSIQRGSRELQLSRDRTLTGRGWGPAHIGDGSSPDPLLQAPGGAHDQPACSATISRASQVKAGLEHKTFG